MGKNFLEKCQYFQTNKWYTFDYKMRIPPDKFLELFENIGYYIPILILIDCKSLPNIFSFAK